MHSISRLGWRGVAALALCAGALTHAQTAGVEARVDALLARMTLEEKLGQLQQLAGQAEGDYSPEQEALTRKGLVGSLLNVRGAARVNTIQRVAVEGSRLKIPLLLGFDVIHGYRTVFPIPLGEAASWDPAGAEQSSAIAAAETAAVGLKWTFAPMVDIARDPRWGRIAEGAGEDPYLGMAFARARVRGFQGPDMSQPDRVMACVKHYVGYGATEGGRDYNTTDISERVLRETYLPPFRAAIADAGAQSVMSAFNDLNGVPTSANPFTLTDVLRKEWKFDGLVVSDWESVGQLLDHRVAADGAEAAAQALDGGRGHGDGQPPVQHARRGPRETRPAVAGNDRRGGAARPAGEVPSRPLRSARTWIPHSNRRCCWHRGIAAPRVPSRRARWCC